MVVEFRLKINSRRPFACIAESSCEIHGRKRGGNGKPGSFPSVFSEC